MGIVTPIDRPDLFIVARILERLWRENEPILKTHLQRGTNLNYDIFSRYLSWMVARSFVLLEISSDGHERVHLTTKGLEAYKRLLEWLNEFVDDKIQQH
jgi:predicted transcriptional regulator